MKMRSVPILPFVIAGLLVARLTAAEPAFKLSSPNGAIIVDVRLDDRVRYDVTVNESPVLKNSTLSLKIDAVTLGLMPHLRLATPGTHDAVLKPVVRQKAAELRDHYNEL